MYIIEVNMIVDAVITYVDGNDPIWRRSMNCYSKNVSKNRFRDWGTLINLLTNIRTYMKYVRNIYLVVSSESQVKGKNIRDAKVITHSQIIPSKFLPTFNSCTIEMFFHNIPDLAEHFIYFNDDTLPIASSELSDFFTDDGHPCQAFKQSTKGQVLNTFRSQCKNSSDLARRLSGLPESDSYVKPDHICVPMLKSTYEKIWSLARAELEASITRFRDDKNFNQYLFGDYNLYSNITVQKRLDYVFLKTLTEFEQIISNIENPQHRFICLNDTGSNNFVVERNRLNAAFSKNLSETRNVRRRMTNATTINFKRGIVSSSTNKTSIKPIPTTIEPSVPTDLVLTYVTSDDPSWCKLYKSAILANHGSESSWESGVTRFRDPGTLQYLFRSIEVNLPWINKVHFVVMDDSQVPAWLDTEKVHIVRHRDFIPEEYLPTFNSCVIEMFLHNIPGLSEQFIYSNDDIFFTRGLQPSYFFRNKIPSYYINYKPYSDSAPNDKCRINAYNLITNQNQRFKTYTTQHGPIPYRVSWMKECFNRFNSKLLNTLSTFRTDNSISQYVYAFYQYKFRNTFNDRKNGYSTAIRPGRMSLIIQSLNRYDYVCINDSDTSDKEMWDQIKETLRKKFPRKSKYELC